MKLQIAVTSHTDKTGGVYSDDLVRATGQSRVAVTRYLRANGFHKTGGCTSKRWAKDAGARAES